MKYKSKYGKRTVEVSKIKDGYVYFRINGTKTIVTEKMFLKVYEEAKNAIIK